MALAVLIFGATVVAHQKSDQQKGSIKGKVRVESGSAVDGATVTVFPLESEAEAGRATTNRKGDFELTNLAPGLYRLTVRKTGLSVGTMEKVEVVAGKVKNLSDRLVMSIDEGTLAFLRGSVFDPDGRSVRGVEVTLQRLEAGSLGKKYDNKITDESGSFMFRLPPAHANYRVTVKSGGIAPVTKDVEIDGAAIYRVALTLQPTTK
ncbi:MAG TPA: carboxypeptidase-like regulatory domain-containing protein [Pyrinomonadaceae bacterium]|nr:carboxypeptidase-like regulatory domain-containing protein [Pyrinomonadaceae bacterium]